MGKSLFQKKQKPYMAHADLRGGVHLLPLGKSGHDVSTKCQCAPWMSFNRGCIVYIHAKGRTEAEKWARIYGVNEHLSQVGNEYEEAL